MTDRHLTLDPGRGAVADHVVHQLRVGREPTRGRGDPQPAAVDDRDVELGRVVREGALDHEQPAGGIQVVGQHVDDAGDLAVDGQGVRHGDGVAGRLGRGEHVDAHRLPVHLRVAERRVVVNEVGAWLVTDERDDAAVQLGPDRGAGLGRDLPAQGELRIGRARVGARQVVEQWPDLDRLADLASHDVRLSGGGECLGVEPLLHVEDQRLLHGSRTPVADGDLDLNGVAALTGSGEPDSAVGGGAGSRAGVPGPEGDRVVEDKDVAVLVVTPVREHRHGQGLACRHLPTTGLEAGAQRRLVVLAISPDGDRDSRVSREVAASVVDRVVERGVAGPVGHLEDDRLSIGTDLGPRPSRGLVDVDDAQQSPLGRGVVVEGVQDRHATSASAVLIRHRLGRRAVSGALLLALLVLVLDLLAAGEGVPVVDLHGLG